MMHLGDFPYFNETNPPSPPLTATHYRKNPLGTPPIGENISTDWRSERNLI